MLEHSDPPDAVFRAAHGDPGAICVQGDVSLTPVLKLEGAQLDGSDLLLRANFSSDWRSLRTLTPSEIPLSAGNHPLRLSLNGQFSEQERRDLVSPHPC